MMLQSLQQYVKVIINSHQTTFQPNPVLEYAVLLEFILQTMYNVLELGDRHELSISPSVVW